MPSFYLLNLVGNHSSEPSGKYFYLGGVGYLMSDHYRVALGTSVALKYIVLEAGAVDLEVSAF